MEVESSSGSMSEQQQQASTFSSHAGTIASLPLPSPSSPSSLSTPSTSLQQAKLSASQQQMTFLQGQPLPQQQQPQQQQGQHIAGHRHHLHHHPGPRPAPPYRSVTAIIENKDDGPGPRCGHTLTAIAAIGEEGTPGYIGPRLILFGATALEGSQGITGPPTPSGSAGIRLAGATADTHCYDVISNRWTRYIDYLFLGDYVDRGQHILETIILSLALKVEYPQNVHLIRGNHEVSDINALFGFRIECIERMGESDGIWAWNRINQLFNWLPLSAIIEEKIICMHGGIGRSINHVAQIESLQRPITMETGSVVLMDLLWSDPTENDSVEGLRPNARGSGLVTFGPDRVMEFCKNNDLQLIIRAHECVMDGFERFAQGHLITLFSATNYCGTANNAGAILVLGRDLVVVPKLIHPLPPTIISPDASPEHATEDTWMQELNTQRPPTPARGRPQPVDDRNSLAWM